MEAQLSAHVCLSVIDKWFRLFSLAVFLVGSRNYLQLQHFTHFMITAEALNVETNRSSVAGPKRVGRFQLFGDSLTKFYENCVNTVAEADDLAKTEVQVRFFLQRNFSLVCFLVFLFSLVSQEIVDVKLFVEKWLTIQSSIRLNHLWKQGFFSSIFAYSSLTSATRGAYSLLFSS